MNVIKPNLFIPGAAKSGTTSLHELLDLHPDICMSSLKEPVYWTNTKFLNSDKVGWYNNLFSNKEAKIIGESTTSYMYYSEFTERIKKQYNKHPKFIFILRNPIDRCYSHYWYLVGRGQEHRCFRESLTMDSERGFEKYGYLPNYYFHFGTYAYWLEKFYANFESKQIKIITLEQLKTNQQKTVNSCFSFLALRELDTLPEITSNNASKIINPTLYHFTRKVLSGKYSISRTFKYILPKSIRKKVKEKLSNNAFINKSEPLDYPQLNDEERQWVKTFFKEDVKKLKQLTRLSFSEWEDFND